jgi:phosphoglucomutase
MDSMKNFKMWMESEYFDEETKKELESIRDNPGEIEERFYRNLEFGTGGLRGIIGAGTNRMNKYTVRKASQGLATFFLDKDSNAANKGIAIAYDSRFKSAEFALEASKVFAGNGIKVYLFDELRPTPELSFAVRQLGAYGGIVITASHNPKEYNGYKVYGEDGAQMSLDDTNSVYECIEAIKDMTCIKYISEEEAKESGLLKIIGKEIDDEYISRLKTLSVNPESVKNNGNELSIIYTPLNGSGNKLVRRILKECGFSRVFVVKEQELPDPEFSSIKSPNPEDRSALELALKLAQEKNADLIIATDPDCDRLGVGVKNIDGEYSILTGNQVGCLLLEYIISQKKAHDKIPPNPFAVTTIVSSKMAGDICAEYNVELVEVLTGFKFIGEKIRELDENGDKSFLFGFEESLGYLAGTHSRDKDAVVASMLVSEMAAWYMDRNMSLYEGLEELYQKYGYYMENIVSHGFVGKAGAEKMENIMKRLRDDRIVVFGKYKAAAVYDYLKREKHDVVKEVTESVKLPASNVLYYEMEDSSWFCMRPSGTEPKIKIYFGVKDITRQSAQKKLVDYCSSITDIVLK